MEKQRIVLITGATGGIGKAISERFAKQGCRLLLHYHQNKREALDMQQEFSKRYNCEVLICQADLSIPVGVDELVNQLPYRPHIIVHNAGAAHYGLFRDVSMEDYDRLLQLHLTSPFRLTQQLLSTMLREKWGRIIFVTSVWADKGAAGEVLYSMTKGGVTSLMKALAKELAPSGITVNAVAPGVINTRMNHHLSQKRAAGVDREYSYWQMGSSG